MTHRTSFITSCLAALLVAGVSIAAAPEQTPAQDPEAARGPATNETADTAITEKVKAALTSDTRTKAAQIEVSTNNGMVQLAGSVADQTAKYAATEVARSVAGVKGVLNQLEVKG